MRRSRNACPRPARPHDPASNRSAARKRGHPGTARKCRRRCPAVSRGGGRRTDSSRTDSGQIHSGRTDSAEPAATQAPPAQATTPTQATAKARPEKRKLERFKLAGSDRRRLGTLGAELKAAGRRPSKSELVRAGIAALAAQGAAEVMALVDTLSPAARAKDKKARRKKDDKAAGKRRNKSKGKSASKKR